MEDNSKLTGFAETAMAKIKELVNVDTVVGSPIETADGVTLIPVSRVSYGFGVGGSDLPAKSASTGFAGGNGAGVKVDPVGFIVVKDGNVRFLNIAPPASDTVGRIIDKTPEIIDRVDEFIDKHKKSK